MESLFSPCTRLHDVLERQDRLDRVRGHPEPLQELNLDVSTEELLSSERAFTYTDLYAMLGNRNTVAWLTPYGAVVRGGGGLAMFAWNQQLDNESCRFRFTVDGKLINAFARSSEHLLEICDFVLRLSAVSAVQSVWLFDWNHDELINAPTLAYLMEQCQSLKFLSFLDLKLDEAHCRVLGTYSRPDLKIILNGCKVTSAGARALVEVLGRNQGPTKLNLCEIDNAVLADGLRGNSRLKLFTALISSKVRDQEVFAIAGALRESKGLVELNLKCDGFRVNDETWGVICDSLKAHPTLEVLDLPRGEFTVATATPALLSSQIQKLVDMMKVNMSIHTIRLDSRYTHHELFQGSVIPYLETNQFRPRILAIQRTCPITYRVKVLGRAFLTVRTDPNRFWMLLSGNAEVAFP